MSLNAKAKTDINLMLQRRIKVIEDEMIKLNKHLRDFVHVVDFEFMKFLGNISCLHNAQQRLKSYSFKNPILNAHGGAHTTKALGNGDGSTKWGGNNT